MGYVLKIVTADCYVSWTCDAWSNKVTNSDQLITGGKVTTCISCCPGYKVVVVTRTSIGYWVTVEVRNGNNIAAVICSRCMAKRWIQIWVENIGTLHGDVCWTSNYWTSGIDHHDCLIAGCRVTANVSCLPCAGHCVVTQTVTIGANIT